MEFDENGVITPEALMQLLELERQEVRAVEAHAHNMDVKKIASLGQLIVNHCLSSVAKCRDLLELEGALNIDIARFLKTEGYKIEKRDSRGKKYLRTIADGVQVAEAAPRSAKSTRVSSDLIVDEQGDRVELKTAAFATSKDSVPDELFDKDLAYIERDPYSGDLERYSDEGLCRSERQAEFILFVADKKIAQGSPRLCSLVGGFDSDKPVSGKTLNGLTYEIHTGAFEPSEVLEVKRKRTIRIESFIVLLVYPSLQH